MTTASLNRLPSAVRCANLGESKLSDCTNRLIFYAADHSKIEYDILFGARRRFSWMAVIFDSMLESYQYYVVREFRKEKMTSRTALQQLCLYTGEPVVSSEFSSVYRLAQRSTIYTYICMMTYLLSCYNRKRHRQFIFLYLFNKWMGTQKDEKITHFLNNVML